MQKESNAENSQKSFLHYFHTALSDHLSLIDDMIPYVLVLPDMFDYLLIKGLA